MKFSLVAGLTLLVFLFFACISPVPCAQQGPQPSGQQVTQPKEPSKKSKKELEAEVKNLVADGKVLESQGKLSEARDKYVDAEGILSTSDALSAIARIDDQQKQRVATLLAEARRSFDVGKFSDGNEQLQKGLELQPSNAALQYDLGLGYLKMGDRADTARHLDLAVGALSDEKKRMELLELHSSVLMGTPPPAAENAAASSFNQSYIQEDFSLGDTHRAGGSLCDQTKALQGAFPGNAAVAFNFAKCATQAAQPADAARQLAEYAKLAPEALDLSDVGVYRQNLESLASLPGDDGQLVRQHFATAGRYLDYRHYNLAIAEYEAAAQVSPDYPQTQWRLGLLYEAYGDTAKAREHFLRYQQLAPDSDSKSAAELHLSALDARRAIYDATIGEAQDALSELLLTSLGLQDMGAKHKTKLSYRQWRWASHQYKEATRATEKLSQPYVERELNRARQELESAIELAPLGAGANELLGLIELQGNNWPEAYRRYDSVASQGFPVSFYAQVHSASDSKVVRATKVEISADSVRLVHLSSYDPKKQVSVPPSRPAGEDDLGNVVVSADHPPDAEAEAVTIHAKDLKAIQTDKNFVVLKLEHDQIYLAPLNMLAEIPFEGGASRTFGNEYTRMFIRYLGYEDAKLGKEGMTTGEKFKLGFELARIGASFGMMGMGSPMAISSGVRAVRLIRALKRYRSLIQDIRDVRQGVRAADLTDTATRLTDDIQMAAETLERTADDERRAIWGMEFKIIPAQQTPLKFREKL
jgi:tetratricopeptide (TPR) repeat protein